MGLGLPAFVALLLAAGGLADAWAQAGIYTCVDSKGRRLTSDRPIPECIDREQKELGPTGTVKRVLKPTMTAEEQAAEDERQRRASEEKARQAEEKKRERVLLARYPDRPAHDRERALALVAVEEVMATARKRMAELEAQRRDLAKETEFFQGDKSKFPAKLKRQLEESEQTIAAQKRFIDNQAQEKQRVNTRFDEELLKLGPLWAELRRTSGGAQTAATPASSAAKR